MLLLQYYTGATTDRPALLGPAKLQLAAARSEIVRSRVIVTPRTGFTQIQTTRSCSRSSTFRPLEAKP